MTAGVGPDSITISGSSLAENWPQVSALITQALAKPAFAAGEFEAPSTRQGRHRRGEKLDRSLGRRFYAEALYGSILRSPGASRSASLDLITLEDVRNFYAQRFSGEGAIVGCLASLTPRRRRTSRAR